MSWAGDQLSQAGNWVQDKWNGVTQWVKDNYDTISKVGHTILEVIGTAGPFLGAAIGFVVGGPAGAAAGWALGEMAGNAADALNASWYTAEAAHYAQQGNTEKAQEALTNAAWSGAAFIPFGNLGKVGRWAADSRVGRWVGDSAVGRVGGQAIDWAAQQGGRAAEWVGTQGGRAMEWAGRQRERAIDWTAQQGGRAIDWAGRQGERAVNLGRGAVDWAGRQGEALVRPIDKLLGGRQLEMAGVPRGATPRADVSRPRSRSGAPNPRSNGGALDADAKTPALDARTPDPDSPNVKAPNESDIVAKQPTADGHEINVTKDGRMIQCTGECKPIDPNTGKPFDKSPELETNLGDSSTRQPASSITEAEVPKAEVVNNGEITTGFEDIELDKPLGSGGNKVVYSVKGNDEIAVGVLKAGKPPALVDEEIKILEQLQAQGLSTVEIIGKTAHGGQAAIVMKRYAQGSKDIVRLERGKIRIVGQSQLLNQKSIEDLSRLRSIVQDKKIKIDDLQFLIGKDGSIVIADPLKVIVGQPPSRSNIRMIDLLIESSRKNLER